MPIRLKDIAQALGRDLSTVSRALRDDPRVKPKTRQLIKEKAQAMGYAPNLHARALASGKTNTVWMVIPSLTNLIERVPAQHLGKMLQEHDYDLYIIQYYYDDSVYRRVLDRLGQGNADAAVIIPSHQTAHDFEKELVEEGVPLVYLDRIPQGIESAHVTSDNTKAVQEMCRGLLDQGIDQFVVTFNDRNSVEIERNKAARQFLKKSGCKVFEGEDENRFPELPNRKTAVLGSVDTNVNASMKQLQYNNPDVPFFFGVFESWLVRDPAAAEGFIIYQDFEKMAEEAGRAVLSLIHKESTPSQVRRIGAFRVEAVF